MLDFNGDGYLSGGEVACSRACPRFDAADANHGWLRELSRRSAATHARELRAQKDKAEASSKADSSPSTSSAPAPALSRRRPRAPP
jgi:hypothetical protein